MGYARRSAQYKSKLNFPPNKYPPEVNRGIFICKDRLNNWESGNRKYRSPNRARHIHYPRRPLVPHKAHTVQSSLKMLKKFLCRRTKYLNQKLNISFPVHTQRTVHRLHTLYLPQIYSPYALCCLTYRPVPKKNRCRNSPSKLGWLRYRKTYRIRRCRWCNKFHAHPQTHHGFPADNSA